MWVGAKGTKTFYIRRRRSGKRFGDDPAIAFYLGHGSSATTLRLRSTTRIDGHVSHV